MTSVRHTPPCGADGLVYRGWMALAGCFHKGGRVSVARPARASISGVSGSSRYANHPPMPLGCPRCVVTCLNNPGSRDLCTLLRALARAAACTRAMIQFTFVRGALSGDELLPISNGSGSRPPGSPTLHARPPAKAGLYCARTCMPFASERRWCWLWLGRSSGVSVARALAGGDGAAEALSPPTALTQVGVTIMVTFRSIAAVVATVLTRLDEAGGGLRCVLCCCNVCRAWRRPGRCTSARTSLSDTPPQSRRTQRQERWPVPCHTYSVLPTPVGDAVYAGGAGAALISASASACVCPTHPRRCCGLKGRRRSQQLRA
jgi:hypothetical protein